VVIRCARVLFRGGVRWSRAAAAPTAPTQSRPPTCTPAHHTRPHAGTWTPARGEAEDDAVAARIADALSAIVAAHSHAVGEAVARHQETMVALLAGLERLAALDGCVRARGCACACARASSFRSRVLALLTTTRPPARSSCARPCRLEDCHTLVVRLDLSGFYGTQQGI